MLKHYSRFQEIGKEIDDLSRQNNVNCESDIEINEFRLSTYERINQAHHGDNKTHTKAVLQTSGWTPYKPKSSLC